MLNVDKNLKQGIKSQIHISTEKDRKLIRSMVRGNILQEPISFDDLVTAINNSNGRVLECHKENHVIVYFDSTGKYISDYKGVYGKPSIVNPNVEKTNVTKTTTSFKEFTSKKPTSTQAETLKKSVKMYRGVPIN